MLAPIKIFISYKKGNLEATQKASNNKESGKSKNDDLKVYYSFSNPKPEESNCDGMILDSPQCVTIKAPNDERFFPREFVFLKLQTIMGCQGHIKLVYPKQDFQDTKAQQQAASMQTGEGATQNALKPKFGKIKGAKELEYKINQLLSGEGGEYQKFKE